MRLQPIVLTLAIGALVFPLSAARAQGGGGHATSGQVSGGHAASGHSSGGHASGRAAGGQTMSGRANGSTVASRGDVRSAHRAMRRSGSRSTNGVAPAPPTPGMPLPNPIVVGSAALLGPAPGGDIFRARPNTYGRHSGSRSIVGTGFVAGPWFNGGDVAEPATSDEMPATAPPVAVPAEPATIIAAGPPATDSPDDLHKRGEVRFDVQPLAAQVFADGELRGTIADFYHSLVGLSLVSGRHHLELRAPGYETAAADVTVIAGRTVVYRVILKTKN